MPDNALAPVRIDDRFARAALPRAGNGSGGCGCGSSEKSELEKAIAERPILAIFAAFALGWLLKGRK